MLCEGGGPYCSFPVAVFGRLERTVAGLFEEQLLESRARVALAEDLRPFLTGHLLDLLEQVQEVCDRVGIIFNGKMVSEGNLEDLISIEDQIEFILENASPDLLEQIEKMADGEGAKVLRKGHPRTTLEKLFLEQTRYRPFESAEYRDRK